MEKYGYGMQAWKRDPRQNVAIDQRKCFRGPCKDMVQTLQEPAWSHTTVTIEEDEFNISIFTILF